jgi:hypothetical protein
MFVYLFAPKTKLTVKTGLTVNIVFSRSSHCLELLPVGEWLDPNHLMGPEANP